MDLDLNGKTAIVTGGSASIGLACAKALAREGVHTVIAARNQQRLEQAAVQEDGRIVNINGGAGRTPLPTFPPESTANATLLIFTKGISTELIRHNVRINAISPTSTATERAKLLNKQIADVRGISEQEASRQSVGGIPLGRLVDPAEVESTAREALPRRF